MNSRLDLESLAARAQRFSAQDLRFLRNLKLGTWATDPPPQEVRDNLVKHFMIEQNRDQLTDAGDGLVEAVEKHEKHLAASESKD